MFDVQALLAEAEGTPLVNQSLVNQSPAQPSSGGGFYDLWKEIGPHEEQVVAPTPKAPETWGGEFTSAFSRGWHELEQMGYGFGALTSSWMGADGMKDWFLKGYNAQTQIINQEPETVKSAGGALDSFDHAIRYGLSATGEFLPLVGQTLVASAIGSFIGTAAEPGGGTIAGGVTGIVARKAVSNLLKTEVKGLIGEGVAKELGEYVAGTVSRDALSVAAKKVLEDEGLAVAKKYGSLAAVGASNMAIMQGALYGELAQNEDIPESDRRWASTVGGAIASIPMTGVFHLVAAKFNPGKAVAEVTKEEVAEQTGYMSRFLLTGGKEMAKNFGEVAPAMFMQTAVNIAAKNWADPNTRWDFMSYTPEQWQEMIDASIKGGVGGAGVMSLPTTIAAMSKHPSPKVRSGVRDVLTKAADVAVESPEVTPEHRELSKVQERIGEIESVINKGEVHGDDLTTLKSELSDRQGREQELLSKLGMVESEEPAEVSPPLVNQTTPPKVEAPEVKNEAPPLSTPSDASVDDLRAFYAERMAREGASKEAANVPEQKVADKQAEVDAHIEQISGGTEYGAELKKAFTPDLVRMMASEDVHLTSDSSASGDKVLFGAKITNDGKIHLYVPTAEEAVKDAARSGGDPAKAQKDYVANTQSAVAHEIGHVADLINIRDQWRAEGSKEKLGAYTNEVWRKRGESFRAAEPNLPKTMSRAYFLRDMEAVPHHLSDIQLGQELPRMAVEMARNGKTSEVTEALAKAARNDGPVTAFFRDWIRTLKSVGETIRKWLDPKTANPELLKAYDDINKTLDKYGVLVNESEAKVEASAPDVKSPESPAPEVKPTAKPVAAFGGKSVVDHALNEWWHNGGINTSSFGHFRNFIKNILPGGADVKQVWWDSDSLANRDPSKGVDYTTNKLDVNGIAREAWVIDHNGERAIINRPNPNDPNSPGIERAPAANAIDRPVAPVAPVAPKVEPPASATPEVKPEVPVLEKPATLYSKFRYTIKNGSASDQVRAYLDWQKGKEGIPATKAETRAALDDFRNRAPNTAMTLDRFQNLVNERIQNEKKATPGQSELAQKTRFGNDDEAESGERDESVSGDTGGEDGYYHRVSNEVAEARKRAPSGQRLAAVQKHIAENHPHLMGHVENIVREVRKAVDSGDREETRNSWRYQPEPLRGQDVAAHIGEYKYSIQFPTNSEITRQLAEDRGLHSFGPGESYDADSYVIRTDIPGELQDDLVNESASVHPPVQVTNKLKEAQLASGIPETHPVHAFRVDALSNELLDVFDQHFGKNDWILKSYSPDALQSEGVVFAEALRVFSQERTNEFLNVDTSEKMVQKLHDITESDRASNQKILSGKEVRVHVLTDMDGNAHILPFSTFWKMTRDEAAATPLSRLTPIMVEGPEILAAHHLALESIHSLPLSDRTGQFYGLDIIRTKDGGWGVVELNPSDENGQSAFFNDSALSHESYMAALMGDRPLHAELAQEVHNAYTEDNPLVNQKKVVDESSLSSSNARSMLKQIITPLLDVNHIDNYDQIDVTDSSFKQKMRELLDPNLTQSDIDEKLNQILEEPDRTVGTGSYGSTDLTTHDFARNAQSSVEFARQQGRGRGEPEGSEMAEKPKFGKDAQKRLDDIERVTNEQFGKPFALSTMPDGNTRTRERGGGKGEYEHMSPQAMEYQVQPKQEAMVRAQMLLNHEGGAVKVAEELLTHGILHPEYVQRLAGSDEAGAPVNAGIAALADITMRQIDAMRASLEGDGRYRVVKQYLSQLFHDLETQRREVLAPIGRFSSITHTATVVMNGSQAHRSYVEPIIAHLQKVLGKPGAKFIANMVQALNGVMADWAEKVVTRPEVIAYLEKINKLIHTRAFQEQARRTYTMSDARMRNAVKGMAARMAEHVAVDPENPEWANEAAKRIVTAMNGLPASSDGRSEVEIFNAAVSQVARDNARELGLIQDSGKKPVSLEDKFSAILNNESMYSQFNNVLRRRMMEEYKPEPGSPFAQKVDEFFGNMENRHWSQGMVETLVNKNLREFETTFAQIAKEHYGATTFSVEKMREAVRLAMEERGVKNEGLLDQLIEDVDGDVRSRIEQARMDFMGGPAGVKEFLLKKMQATLAAKAKEHALAKTDLPEKLSSWLSDDFGLPDTPEMPIASSLHDIMMRQYNEMLEEQRKSIVKDMVTRAAGEAGPKNKGKVLQSVDKILQLANLGVMRDETAYNALADKFGLPEYNPEIAQQIVALGDAIATSPNERITDAMKQTLSNLIASQKGVRPYDMFLAGLYTNMLSGPSTAGVHISSNAASVMGHVVVSAIQNPKNIPAITRAIFRAATGSGQIEMRETFWTGLRMYRTGDKFFHPENPLEMENPVFKSSLSLVDQNGKMGALNQKAQAAAEATAGFMHKLYRGVKGQYIGRYLSAADAFFYKIAQEASFAAKTGWTETPEIRGSAMDEARRQMKEIGQNPEDSKEAKRRQEIMANQIINEMRTKDPLGNIDPDLHEAWVSSHNEAMDATFKQTPKGLLGSFSRLLEKWGRGEDGVDNPLGRMLIPFTRIAANVTNQMLEWTPYGLVRWGAGHLYGEDFRLKDEDGKIVGRDPKIAIRALLGTAGTMALWALFAQHHDDKDPWLAVYDDGSKNPQRRRQMMDMGWRPKTIKVGDGYYSYVTTPYAMMFSILGRHFDNIRDGHEDENGFASSAVAMLQTATHESFLASLTDFMSAVDSPNPEAKISRMMARMATGPILPNFVKQIDKWVSPNIQQSQGFAESFMKEFPIVRNYLKPSLNIFGEQLKHDPAINMPGTERFLTMEKTDDPVYNYLSEAGVTVPGFSKSSRLGNVVMTRDQYYRYVEEAGPQMKRAISAEIPQLRTMSNEHQQERLNEIVRKIKQRVRDNMRANP